MTRTCHSAVRLGLLAVMALVAVLPVERAAAIGKGGDLSSSQRKTLQRYAGDTWHSFQMMTDAWGTGLPSDNVSANGVASRYTSPTNIGAYIWSTLAARDLQIITPQEARERIGQTLTTLEHMDRHQASGMFYNWYDPASGAVLHVWPVDGGLVYPFLSSVDNGWLAAALIMVTNSVPQLRDRAWKLVDSMNFGFYYNPTEGQIRGGYWTELPPKQVSVPAVNSYDCTAAPATGATGAGFTCHHYGTLNTEPRIASYIGIAMGDIPPEHYFRMFRTFPDNCDWSWPEMDPDGVTRTYLGVDVYEGHYRYRGMNIVPSWGGSMFEALMVPLLVPEEQWGPQSWGVNHPLYVEAQIEHGLDEAQYGYWGFSPASDPEVVNGYREYGVDAIGMNTDGYTSDVEHTLVDYGFRAPDGQGWCPGREPKPLPMQYGQGVVTPHAVFLALDFAPDATMANLAKLDANFPVYGAGGFYDAVNVASGTVAQRYLALDQGMIMAAIANAVRGDRLQHYFTQGMVEDAIKPLLGLEQFTAGRAP